ncbi:hybrid sensor histidine kinase/response regulator [Iningainema tapete]|uniref:Circadian input-output histidine kinase CikA n=1 Tax=Iningainema tapete BLCC-T55 TaxID=2748662 RepID=A0A8J6XT10_9CYAN|nr:ATP-binding protein [Iningainema tapete]MBD2777859.1 response regulator [Iningainema tapete BLCC-T55]
MNWNQHLTTKVASSFLILSLVTVGVVGGVAFLKAREALKRASYSQLSVSAALKEEEISRWFEDQQRDFLLTTKFPDVQANLKTLLNQDVSQPNQTAAKAVLSKYFKDIVELQPNFREIFILDRSSRVILSTDRLHEQQYEVSANITYIKQVELGFSPNFYVSPVTGKPAVTLATPVLNKDGVRIGIILAHLNLERIDEIVRQNTGLGKSGETYLVGSLVTKYDFISKPKANTRKFPQGVHSQGIDKAMNGISAQELYKNYAGVPVIGVYRWLNNQNLALLVEMHQEEAFAPARQLAGTITGVGLASAMFLFVGVYWLTRQLEIARQQLENYSHELEVKAQEAEAANLAKSEFLANMSHELRTPLNSILGFAQLMQRDRSTTKAHLENLEIISRSGEHLLTLINDVLSMAKIEAGRTTLNENSFDLYSLLDSVAEMFTQKAESKGLQLIVERNPHLPRYVQTDESKLRQILINLLGNAIKFTQQGSITLRVTIPHSQTPPLPNSPTPKLPHSLHFQIEDTGVGIAATEIENLFKPFVQTHAGRISQQGTGLGLTISRKFVNLMGGDISVSSTLGKGTIFDFDIQISLVEVDSVQTARINRRVIGLEPNQPKYRILVVEDKWENRQLLLKMLLPLGFEVREAENGLDGVRIWETWEPHLIWMDMRMPVMDGYEATKQIKAHLKGQATTIIALTASAFDEQRNIILSIGCDDFVRKPFQEEVILEKMGQYLGVRYVYEQEIPSSEKSENTELSSSLLQNYLAQMPTQWVAQLHQAALCTDEKQIFSLIEQIPEECAPLAHALTDWVNNFRIDKVIDITQIQENE